MILEQKSPRIETIIGTMDFPSEEDLCSPYSLERFRKYEFDREFRGKFLYIPTSDKEIFIAIDGRVQEARNVEAREIQHERIKELLVRVNPETEQITPSAGGYCTIIPSRNFVAFFGTTIKYQRGIDEMKDGLVARALNQASGRLIHRVLPLKVAPDLAKEIQEIHLDENGNPYVKIDFSHMVRRLKC